MHGDDKTMTFKKDYINYLLYTVVNSPESEFTENYRLKKIVDSVISNDDVKKVTFLIGKTAGLEVLFKYLLYISDKIDKSQVTIFNLKDNFEYDKINIAKICANIAKYKSENVQEVIENITENKEELTPDTVETKAKNTIKIETTDSEDEIVPNLVDIEDIQSASDENETEDTGLTLIENAETYTGEAEVFELESISESVENSDKENELTAEDKTADSDDIITDEDDIDIDDENDSDEIVIIDETEENVTENPENETGENEDLLNTGTTIEETLITETADLPDIEIEVRKPRGTSSDEEHLKEETITNEAYYKFETKFFEEVKILEKLLATVSKDCTISDAGKQSEKCLQCLTEIIGITSELSSLSRQLSFDLIADIFLTMNIYFTKSISQPDILTTDRIRLLDSSLALVNSLIKGEDYLNYDTIVDRMEKLKKDIAREQKSEKISTVTEEMKSGEDAEISDEENEMALPVEENSIEKIIEEKTGDLKPVIEQPAVNKSEIDSANFKLKYLIKEFEKSFAGINSLKGEYSKFEAIEKISELNNALRLIAKISASIGDSDVLKLAEVTYVFLKYVKDYRMDMLEPEIQQIIKYIIFTFKMLLTNRKPEDFNVLVQHLNNPVKIFADS